MSTDFTLPHWAPVPAAGKSVSDAAYLAWLAAERAALIENGQLKAILADPLRCPVDVRFVWHGGGAEVEGLRVEG